MKKLILVFLFSVLNCQLSFSQEEIIFQKIDSLVNKVIADWKVPGLAISIIKDGKVFYKQAYGYKNLETKKTVKTNTLFSIASSSKAFTATLSAMLVDEKKIEWEKPLINYFPAFKAYNEHLTSHLTIKDLLTHRSGVPRQKFFSLNTPDNRLDVRKAFQYFEPSQDLRNKFQYCNETYTIAGDMLAEIENTSWENLITKRIFSPLGMNSTELSIHDADEFNYASPYIIWEEEPELLDRHDADILGPAGCIISNVEDLSKWLIFNLNSGKVDSTQLISNRNLSYIQSPHIVVPTRLRHKELSFVNYGIGWFAGQYRSFRHIHHGGVLYGFSSQVSMLPDENIGIVVLANLNGTKATNIIEHFVYDLLTEQEVINWNKRYLDEYQAMMEYYKKMENKAENKKQEYKLAVPLGELCGSFESKGYGKLNIYLKNDTLRTKLLEHECPLLIQGSNKLGIYHPVEHRAWNIHFNESPQIDTLKADVARGVKAINFVRVNQKE